MRNCTQLLASELLQSGLHYNPTKMRDESLKPQKTISFPFTGGMTPTQTHLHFNTHKKALSRARSLEIHYSVLSEFLGLSLKGATRWKSVNWSIIGENCQKGFQIVFYRYKWENGTFFGLIIHCEQSYKRCFRFPFSSSLLRQKNGQKKRTNSVHN